MTVLLLIDGDNLAASRLTALRQELQAHEILIHHSGSPTRAGWIAAAGRATRIEVAPGRNATDMRLGIEAAAWFARHGTPEAVVLATQDADLLELGRWVLAQGCRLTVVGEDLTTAQALKELATFRPLPPTPTAALLAAVREAFARCRSVGGWVSLSELGSRLRRWVSRKSKGALRRLLAALPVDIRWVTPTHAQVRWAGPEDAA